MIPELTIFEGPPGCGQGALAARVLAALPEGWILHHGPYAEVGRAQLLECYLKPLLQETPSTLIYDRSWIAETIFGPFLTDTDRLGTAGHRYLERVALSRRGVVVLPSTPLETCRLNRLPESEEAELALRQAHHRYNTLLIENLTALPVVRCSAECRVDNLLLELERIRPAANAGPGIGHWKPGQVTLLVGDTLGPSGTPDLPFMDTSLKREGCAAWLAEQLDTGGIREDRLYWVNARQGLETYSPWTDPSFLDDLNPLRVVALGEEAARWCGAVARVKHQTVPHPQHWKRFHLTRPYPLIDLLKEKPLEQRQN